MAHMTTGFHTPVEQGDAGSSGFLFSIAYVSFQELATRISHRNTASACDDPIADRMLQRVALDENLHMIFYRTMCGAALTSSPTRRWRRST